MPLFHIRRPVPGSSPEDVDAAGFRALACAAEFDGLRWIVSHWDAERGELFCIYEAQSAAQILEHSRRARIPCDDVREVIPVRPDDIVNPGTPATEQPAITPL
ncbi:MAG: DUF4242 domain-containing protein [Dehalococcoidia bacterium]|nr:DUF4242 domain-containing protein [Dehalococcoidia bacterium]